jgi:phage baseplate assembly protein W
MPGATTRCTDVCDVADSVRTIMRNPPGSRFHFKKKEDAS